MRLALILTMMLLMLQVAEGTDIPLKEVHASEILTKIKNGLPVEYDHIIVKGDLSLNDVKIVVSPIRINDSVIDGIVSFNNTVLENIVDFTSSTFGSTVDSRYSRFNCDAYFSGSQFNGTADFKGAKFNKSASFGVYASKRDNFLDISFMVPHSPGGFAYVSLTHLSEVESGAKFNRGADFSESQFNGTADFIESQFLADADFRKAKFNGTAYFAWSQFDGSASFVYSQFNDDADFRKAKFNGTAYFTANFAKMATFGEARFNEDADFGGSTFKGNVDFSGSQFNKDALFSTYLCVIAANNLEIKLIGDQFNGDADFGGSTFKGYVDFSRSQFNGTADFKGATFNNSTLFNEVTFQKNIIFSDTVLGDSAFFNSSQFKGDAFFDDTDFKGTLYLTRTKYDKLYIRWHDIQRLAYDDTAYLSLMENFKKLGYLEDYDNCYFEYRKEHRIQNWSGGFHGMSNTEVWIGKKIDFLLEWSYGYGKKPLYPMVWSIVTIILFGAFWGIIARRRRETIVDEYDSAQDQVFNELSQNKSLWGEIHIVLKPFIFSTILFLSGTKLFVDPPEIPDIPGLSKSLIKGIFTAERVLGAFCSILIFLAIGATIVRQ